jgi:hypothetical protein
MPRKAVCRKAHSPFRNYFSIALRTVEECGVNCQEQKRCVDRVSRGTAHTAILADAGYLKPDVEAECSGHFRAFLQLL